MRSSVLHFCATVVSPFALLNCEIKDETSVVIADSEVPEIQIHQDEASSEWIGLISFSVSISRNPTEEVSINYKTFDHTATQGNDFVSTAGTLQFLPDGDMSHSVTISILDDSVTEGDESFKLEIEINSGNAKLGVGNRRTATIYDNDLLIWPASTTSIFVDSAGSALGGNLSGLTYQPSSETGTGFLWSVRNSPSQLYRHTYDVGTGLWINSQAWTLTYPSGLGSPDAEGVTKAEWSDSSLYIASERDGGGGSRLSVLRFDSASGQMVQEWNMTHNAGNTESVDVTVGSNAGWEAITWVPDVFLVENSFYDARLNQVYDPTNYPNHGAGLFFCGLEENGKIYAYALNHADSTFRKVAVISSGMNKIMGLEFDRDTGYLWGQCDDSCNPANRTVILEINPNEASHNYGRFQPSRLLTSPVSGNQEAIALFPDAEGSLGLKDIFWANDSGGHGSTISRGVIPSGLFLPF